MRLTCWLTGAIALLLLSCASEPEFDSVYHRVTAPTLTANQPLPPPSGTPIFTVTGKIGAANSSGQIVMDLALLEAVGLVEYDAFDPFERRQSLFQGVLMRDLLTLWQVEADATVLEITALDDYQVEVPIPLLQEYPLLLALKQDGRYLERSYRGPAMLVFPYNDYEFNNTVGDPLWIWQIKTMVVK